MWQTLITLCIVGIAAFFIGKKLYHQIDRAINPRQNVSCNSGCSGCDVTNCDHKNE